MTRMITFILFALYGVASTAGLVLLKLGTAGMKVAGVDGSLAAIAQVSAGAVLYISAFLIWLLIVARVELSFAYPIAIGLTLVLLTLATVFLLGENVGALRYAGMVLVFAGIVLLSRPA